MPIPIPYTLATCDSRHCAHAASTLILMDPIPLPRVPLGAPRATAAADSTMPLSAMPHSAVELEPLERAVERAVEPRERIAHAPRERTQEEVAPPPPPPPPTPPHPQALSREALRCRGELAERAHERLGGEERLLVVAEEEGAHAVGSGRWRRPVCLLKREDGEV